MRLQVCDGEVRKLWIHIKGKGRDRPRDPSVGKEVGEERNILKTEGFLKLRASNLFI